MFVVVVYNFRVNRNNVFWENNCFNFKIIIKLLVEEVKVGLYV